MKRLAWGIVALALLTLLISLGTVWREAMLAHAEAWQATATAWVEAAPLWSALSFVGIVAVGKVSPFPGGFVLMASGGFLFGALPGALLGAFGSALSALLVAFVGRRLLHDAIFKRWGERLARVEAAVAEDGFSYLLAARLVPVMPAWLVNLVPAVFAIPLPAVFLATFIGVMPVSFILASIGAQVSSLADATAAEAPMLSWDMALPLVGMAAVALAPVAVKHIRRARARRRARAYQMRRE